MTAVAVAVAIGGVALLGGLVALAGRSRTVAGLGAFASLAAVPLLLIVDALVGGSTGSSVGIAGVAVGSPIPGAGAVVVGVGGLLAAAAAAAFLSSPALAMPGPAGTARPRIDPSALLAALAAAMSGLAFSAGAAIGGRADGTSPAADPTAAAAFVAGLGLAVVAVPAALTGSGGRRVTAGIVAIAAAGLLDRAVGPWTPVVALVGPALAAAWVVVACAPAVVPLERAPRRVAEAGARRLAAASPGRAVSALDARVVQGVAVVAPLAVGVGALALLAASAAPTAASGAVARSLDLLAAVGGIGFALVALAALAALATPGVGIREPDSDPAPLLALAASVPVAALALRLGDPVVAVVVAGLAGIVAAGGATPARDLLVTLGLAASVAALRLPALAATPALPLAALAAAVAIAARAGAVPFHHAVPRLADRVPPLGVGLVLGWLPAVAAAVALAGLAGGGATVGAVPGAGGTPGSLPEADADLAALGLVVAVATGTLVLGGLAAWVNRHVRHATGYLIASQLGWVVLAAAAPAQAVPAVMAWLPGFALGAFAIGAASEVAVDRVVGGRGSTRSAVTAVVALGAAVVAWGAIPGTAAWSDRLRIAEAVLGPGVAADLLAVAASLVTIAAVGRLAVGLGRSRAGRSRDRETWRAGATERRVGSEPQEAVDSPAPSLGAITAPVAVGLLSILAVAVGFGLGR